MANPKRRKSYSKQRMRQNANRWIAPQLGKCKECGNPKVAHTACKICGYYGGRQVLSVVAVAE